MIGFGRKKLCVFNFTYFTYEDSIRRSIKSGNWDLKDELFITGEIYENRELGLTKEIIPSLNFLFNYVRSIRTLPTDATYRLSGFSFWQNIYSIPNGITPTLRYLRYIKTTLFYSVRKRAGEKKIYLTQRYFPIFDNEKILFDKQTDTIQMKNEIGYKDTYDKTMDDVALFLHIYYIELVKELSKNDKDRLDSCIELINSIYEAIIKVNEKNNYDINKPNPEVRKKMRPLEIMIYNYWQRLEPRKYSLDEIKNIILSDK